MSQLHGGCIETTCTHPPSGSKVGSRKQDHYTTSNLRDGDNLLIMVIYVEDHKHYTTKLRKGSCDLNKSFDILHKSYWHCQ